MENNKSEKENKQDKLVKAEPISDLLNQPIKIDLGDLPATIERIASNYFGEQKHMEVKNLDVTDSFDQRKHTREQTQYIGNMMFVTVVSLIIFGFAYGLIFQLGKFEYGVLLITHAIALGAGYLSGKGQKKKDDSE